jgi:hypothetical protein
MSQRVMLEDQRGRQSKVAHSREAVWMKAPRCRWSWAHRVWCGLLKPAATFADVVTKEATCREAGGSLALSTAITAVFDCPMAGSVAHLAAERDCQRFCHDAGPQGCFEVSLFVDPLRYQTGIAIWQSSARGAHLTEETAAHGKTNTRGGFHRGRRHDRLDRQGSVRRLGLRKQ